MIGETTSSEDALQRGFWRFGLRLNSSSLLSRAPRLGLPSSPVHGETCLRSDRGLCFAQVWAPSKIRWNEADAHVLGNRARSTHQRKQPLFRGGMQSLGDLAGFGDDASLLLRR